MPEFDLSNPKSRMEKILGKMSNTYTGALDEPTTKIEAYLNKVSDVMKDTTVGEKGEKGDPGPAGPQGLTGPKGDPGEAVTDVSELPINTITESAESYPTYTTTEKMKVILGKIKKYLADLKSNAASLASKLTAAEKNITNIQTDVGGITTALTGKLDKTDVIANLTATTSGKALDATQGKALQDQITQLNSDLNNLSNLVKKKLTCSNGMN